MFWEMDMRKRKSPTGAADVPGAGKVENKQTVSAVYTFSRRNNSRLREHCGQWLPPTQGALEASPCRVLGQRPRWRTDFHACMTGTAESSGLACSSRCGG